MRKIPVFNSGSLPPGINNRITKVTLFNLDGSISEIKLTLPVFGWSGEPQEISQAYLSSYVEHLTVCFLKIHSYQISIGSVDHKGNEVYGIQYERVEIPLNKVYMPDSGTWQDPAQVKKMQTDKRHAEIDRRMMAGKNAIDGAPVKCQPSEAFIHLN